MSIPFYTKKYARQKTIKHTFWCRWQHDSLIQAASFKGLEHKRLPIVPNQHQVSESTTRTSVRASLPPAILHPHHLLVLQYRQSFSNLSSPNDKCQIAPLNSCTITGPLQRKYIHSFAQSFPCFAVTTARWPSTLTAYVLTGKMASVMRKWLCSHCSFNRYKSTYLHLSQRDVPVAVIQTARSWCSSSGCIRKKQFHYLLYKTQVYKQWQHSHFLMTLQGQQYSVNALALSSKIRFLRVVHILSH